MRTVASVVVFALLASLASFAQEAQPCSSAREIRRPVVMTFRAMNTAQTRLYRTTNHYASLPELLSSPELKKVSADMASMGNEPVTFGSSNDPLPGYNLRLLVAADGKSYSLVATKKDGECRHVGATTDERGLIYLIEPMR